MCLLIFKPAGQTIPAAVLRHAATVHDDGFGYAIGEGTTFSTYHSLSFQEAEIETLEAAVDKPVLVHFRMATHGSVTLANVHPFAMPINEHHHTYVAHNGILMNHQPEANDDRSDTRVFIDTVLSRLQPGWWSDPVIVDVIEDELRYNKIVMMWPTGGALILNERLGDWVDGIWYSNDSGFPRQTKYVPTTALVSNVGGKWMGAGVYAETAAYLDLDGKELWCVRCGGDLNGLAPVDLATLNHDPKFFKEVNCTCCHQNLKSIFWLERNASKEVKS